MSNNNSNRNVILATAAGLATASALSLIRSGAHADLLPSLTFNTLGKPFNPISGYVKPGYEPVLEAYRSNFTRGEEVGSTLCIYVKGEKVLDLAGGWTDTTRTKPYSQETVNVTFSSGKAVMVFLCLYAISQGWFKLDEKIVDIWPEFGKGGKEGVKVEDVMAHRGGVAFMEGAFNTVTVEDMLTENLDKLASKIAGSPHNFPNGNKQAYHARTQGWVLNELLRRRHPQKLSAGELWKQLLNPLLGTDVFVGLPKEEDWRCADLVPYPTWKVVMRQYLPEWVTGVWAIPRAPMPATRIKTWATGPSMSPEDEKVPYPLRVNLPAYKRGQGPAFNTCTNARSLARIASILSQGGLVDIFDPSSETFTKRLQIIEPNILSAALEPAPDLGPDENVGPSMPPLTRCGFGYAKHQRTPNSFRLADGSFLPQTSSLEWYGWDGMGGSICVFEKTKGIGVGYTMNALHPGGGWVDVRLKVVLAALVDCLESVEGVKL